jgi:hypothetical protein
MSRNSSGILVILLCLSATAFAANVTKYGLVGAWDFENSYTDVSGVAPL